MEEIWKDVKGWEGIYQVSNLGRVKSVMTAKIRKPVLVRGYHRVVLFKCGTRSNNQVHRVVAESFIHNPENKPQVNHKDGDKCNNHLENLEWCTQSENMIHSYQNGLSKSGEDCYCAKLKNKDIPIIRELHENGMKQKEIAKLYNVSTGPIGAIIKNKKWKHIK